MNTIKILSITLFLSFFSCTENNTTEDKGKLPNKNSEANTDLTESEEVDPYLLKANKTLKPISIDGKMDDAAWQNANWYPLAHTWLGGKYDATDFQGRFKLVWDDSKLYLLTEITDDHLIDIHESWDDNWWNDDCVEIFLDEDNGDDLHQFNHKAFAYHVALNTKDVVDLGPDEKPHLYNNHIVCSKITEGNTTTWEFAIDVYSDDFVDGSETNSPVTLVKGKEMGFCLAYCDNDTSETRENFIASIPVEGETDEERDQGWKDAGVFNTLILE